MLQLLHKIPANVSSVLKLLSSTFREHFSVVYAFVVVHKMNFQMSRFGLRQPRELFSSTMKALELQLI